MMPKSNISAQREIRIRKSTVEWIFITILFICSFINSITLLAALGLSVVLLLQKEVGAIKVLNLITLRTVFNPALGPDIGVWQNIKWLIILFCSVYLIFSYFKLDKTTKNKIKWIIISLVTFMFYNIIVALCVSSLPTIAIFKAISYVLVCMGIFVGIGYTKGKINWLDWIFKIFFTFMVLSFLTIKLPIGYVLNGSFQGLSNQPNMFGILSVLFLALLLTYSRLTKKIKTVPLVVIIVGIFIMILASESRTSLITSSVVLLTYLIVSIKEVKFSYLKLEIIFFTLMFLILFSNLFWRLTGDFFISFMQKGQGTGQILVSRENQLNTLIFYFKENPIFGNGFMVPVLPMRSWDLNMNFIVEPGNLIMSLLSFTGIVGFVIFSGYLFSIFISRKKRFSVNLTLLIAPLLISMGEMVFFSSNNIGTWCYMLLALYVFADTNKVNEITQLEQTVR